MEINKLKFEVEVTGITSTFCSRKLRILLVPSTCLSAFPELLAMLFMILLAASQQSLSRLTWNSRKGFHFGYM